MKQFMVLAIILTFLFSCKNPVQPNKTSAGSVNTDSAKAQDFFPVSDFIGGQVKLVDSFKLPLTKITTIGYKAKQEAVTDQEFRELALNFQQPDISTAALKSKYTESSIADQSIPSITLAYTTTDTSLTVQKINVFIKPDPVNNDKVNAVYIEKSFKAADTLVSQKLYWKSGKNFQITTEKKIGASTLPIQQVKVIWDPE